jgi:hypothetical protein
LSTAGNVLRLSGRTWYQKTTTVAVNPINVTPSASGTTNDLGDFDARLAAQADLYQEWRLLALRVVIPSAAYQNSAASVACDNPYAVGYTNINPNSDPTTLAEILEMPAAHMINQPSTSTTPGTSFTREVLRVPKKNLHPPFTPWLKTIAATGGNDFLYAGNIYSIFNYTASTNTKVGYLVEWTMEFRNPVPAVETLVLRRDSAMGRLVTDFIAHQEDDEEEKSSSVSLVQVQPASATSKKGLSRK